LCVSEGEWKAVPFALFHYREIPNFAATIPICKKGWTGIVDYFNKFDSIRTTRLREILLFSLFLTIDEIFYICSTQEVYGTGVD
jgi:hypothetical protein